MMRCGMCGRRYEDEWKYCGKCGYLLGYDN